MSCLPCGTSPGILLPEKGNLLLMRREALGALRREADRGDSGAGPAPPRCVHHPESAAGVVRAGAVALGSPRRMGLRGGEDVLPGSSRPPRRGTRLRNFDSDVRSVWLQLSSAPPRPCHRGPPPDRPSVHTPSV